MGMDTSPNFTPKAQQLISQAKFFATSLNDQEVEAAHLLLVILNSKHSLIDDFVESFGFSSEEIKVFVTRFCGLKKNDMEVYEAHFSEEFAIVLSKAHEFSGEIGDSYVDVEHFYPLMSRRACRVFFRSLANQHVSKIIAEHLYFTGYLINKIASWNLISPILD